MIKKRVVICIDGIFPRGDAGANRILYLAKAICAGEKEVLVLSFGSESTKTLKFYDGICYQNVCLSTNKYLRFLQKKLLPGRRILALLKDVKLTREDCVFVYGSNSCFVGPILKYCKAIGVASVLDVVEWHQPYQYKAGVLSLRYRSSKKTFEQLAPKATAIMAISTTIASYYRKQSCKVEVIPPLTDTTEQLFCADKTEQPDIHLIYPGKPFFKDDIAVMIKALALLPIDVFQHVYFHMTGTTKEELKVFLGSEQHHVDSLGNHIIFHGWMQYDELTALFQTMDFLFLSRPDNLVTQANFPSKLPELLGWGIVPICNSVGDCGNYLNAYENAYIFACNEPSDAAKAIENVYYMPFSKRVNMQCAARICAKEKFDYRNWIDRLNSFFDII